MPQDFFSSHFSPSSVFFNLCASWNINGWNNKKRKGLFTLIRSLNLYVSVFKKLSIVNFSVINVPPLLSWKIIYQFFFVLIKKLQVWEVYILVFILHVLSARNLFYIIISFQYVLIRFGIKNVPLVIYIFLKKKFEKCSTPCLFGTWKMDYFS